MDSTIDFRPLSESRPETVEWFWPNYLTAGCLAVLDGDPGQGKSLVTLDLAARISSGRPWPDGAVLGGAASVLLLCAEDVEAVITSRLRAAGAELGRVFVWPRHGGGGLPAFPGDIGQLDGALRRTGAKFVVIDPIMAFLDRSVMAGSDGSVRRALQPLGRLAETYGCVILMVRHLCKARDRIALYRGGGSIGFIAACRFGWLAAADPGQPDRHVLAQTKFNYVARQSSLSYGIGANADDRLPRVEWFGPTPWIADELAGRRPKPSRRRAREFLMSFLAAGPRTSEEIWTAAEKLSLSRRTLFRAKDDLGARSVRSPEGRSRIWFLAGHDVERPPSETPALDAWLEEWRAKHQ